MIRLAILCLCLISIQIRAQDSLNLWIKEFQNQSPALKSQELQVQAQKQGIAPLNYWETPNLRFETMNWTQGNKSWKWNFEQTLPKWGRISALKENQNSQILQLKSSLNLWKLEESKQILRSGVALWESSQMLSNLKQKKDWLLLKQKFQLAQARYGQAEMPGSWQQKLELLQWQKDSLDLEQALLQNKSQLESWLGRPVQVPLMNSAPVFPALDSAWRTLQLAPSQAQIQAMYSQIRLSKIESWPALSLGLGYSQSPMEGKAISLMMSSSLPMLPWSSRQRQLSQTQMHTQIQSLEFEQSETLRKLSQSYTLAQRQDSLDQNRWDLLQKTRTLLHQALQGQSQKWAQNSVETQAYLDLKLQLIEIDAEIIKLQAQRTINCETWNLQLLQGFKP